MHYAGILFLLALFVAILSPVVYWNIKDSLAEKKQKETTHQAGTMEIGGFTRIRGKSKIC